MGPCSVLSSATGSQKTYTNKSVAAEIENNEVKR